MKWLLFILLMLMFIPFVQAEGSCFDNIKNCHHEWRCEEGVDCGGPCPTPCKYAFPWTTVIASVILTLVVFISGIAYWKIKRDAGLIAGVLLSIPQIIYILYKITTNRYRCYMQFLWDPSHCYVALVGYPILTIISVLLLSFIFNTLVNHEKYNMTVGKIFAKGIVNWILVMFPIIFLNIVLNGREFLYALRMIMGNSMSLALSIPIILLTVFFVGVVSIRFEYIKNKFLFEDKSRRFLTTIFKFMIIFVILGLGFILYITLFTLLQEAGIIYLGYA